MAQCKKARKRPIAFDCKFDAGHLGNCSPYTLPPIGREGREHYEQAHGDAANLPAERPTCPSSPDHGYMSLRKDSTTSAEQRWCGTWYDCPNYRCGSSTLLPSPELRASLAEQKAAAEKRTKAPEQTALFAA